MPNNHIFQGIFPSIRMVAIFFLFSSVTLGGELAVVPSCSTDATGSSSCNIGINPVPTLGPTLDGGYQWLTQEYVTHTVFGLPIIEHTEVFTAAETNFLDITTKKTIDTTGVTVTNIETQYVSFITATPSVDGVPAAAVVAGVVIAPALIASIQTIADNAAGKTVQQITDEITAAFGLKKATLASGDVQTLANYLYYAVGGAVAIGGIVALKPVTIAPLWTATTIPTNIPSFVTTSTSSTSSPQDSGTAAPVGVSSKEPVYTAIMKYPYTAWQAILAISPPTLTFPAPPSSTPTASCHASNIGIDPGIANELALFFCNQSSLDFSKSESKDVFGSNLNPPVSISSGVFVHFEYTNADGTCALSCWENYNQMIKSCQYNSHSINGIASIADACGTYAMTVTSSSTAPEPTPSPRPLVERTCIDHSAYVSFSRDRALSAINEFCSRDPVTLPTAALPRSRLYRYPDVTINLVISWSRSGQTGCAPYSSDEVSPADCANYCTQAVDLCDTTDGTTKYGAKPLTWSSPIGCIDISIYGTPVG